MKHHPQPDPHDSDITETPSAAHPPTASGRTRRPDGQVALLVLAHLRAHPRLAFTPYELAKLLRLSHGTVRRHLLRLEATGHVQRTNVAPARFQHVA